MKANKSRALASLIFLALMASPLAWAQDNAPAAPETTVAPAPSAAAPAAVAPAVSEPTFIGKPAPQADQPATGQGVEPAVAPASPGAESNSEPGLMSLRAWSGGRLDLLKGVGAFFLVLVLLYMFIKGLGRLSRFKGKRGRESVFELIGIQPLDNRKYLAAVEIEGRVIVVGVTPDRITPVAQWILDTEDDHIDLAAAKLPADEPGLEFKLPEEEDLPLDINISDHSSARPRK